MKKLKSPWLPVCISLSWYRLLYLQPFRRPGLWLTVTHHTGKLEMFRVPGAMAGYWVPQTEAKSLHKTVAQF